MIRGSFAILGGFILVFIESFIVMEIKHYEMIEYGGICPFINIWAMNFFLLFSIFTQIKQWYEELETKKNSSY